LHLVNIRHSNNGDAYATFHSRREDSVKLDARKSRQEGRLVQSGRVSIAAGDQDSLQPFAISAARAAAAATISTAEPVIFQLQLCDLFLSAVVHDEIDFGSKPPPWAVN
jgi:uncharacterized protein (DUF1778 family)